MQLNWAKLLLVKLAIWQILPVSFYIVNQNHVLIQVLAKSGPNFNSPIPGNLTEECAKASRILEQFISKFFLFIFFFLAFSNCFIVKDEIENGFDTIIPVSVIKQAKGLAIFTVLKAGFLWSGRAGSGIVVAK